MLCAALNDDPGTLAAIIDWGITHIDQHQIQESMKARYTNYPTAYTVLLIHLFARGTLDNNPILLCSLAHRSSACLELLYKSGYRISLAERDEKRITAILSLNLTKVTDLQLDYILSREELGLWNKICIKQEANNRPSMSVS